MVRMRAGDDTKMCYVHRLVCTAFHGPPPSPAHVVNHLDGQKLNCRPENLSWCTRAENSRHAALLGLLKGRLAGAKNPNAKLTDGAVLDMRRRSRAGASYTRLAHEYGVSVPSAFRAVVGQTWAHLPLSPGHPVVAVTQ